MAQVSKVPTISGVADLLRSAQACLEEARQRSGNAAALAVASAAWRIADAALLLRQACEHEDIPGMGITEPTGRGALLPSCV